ncbi:hypothetical protein [Metapseudomonas otitidis]|uniref:hypothetical protein n=1 Tax=Metapseudomonas otitidis TaxID=319939 RepID=UPI001AAE5A91|nr:hypothetical protein [Pseudomonas otitidis]MBO2926695.1 hypothetical protein [Pseudomonas otitidis]
MTDKTAKPGELLSRFPEINFNNYGQQEVEALQAWALEAFDALSATLSPAHIEDGEEVEVVGYRVSMPGEPELGTWLDEEAEEEPQIQHHEPLMTVAQHQRIVAARASKAAACVENEREACERWIRKQIGMPARIPMDWDGPFNRYTWAAWSARAALSATPAAGVPDSAYARRIIEAGEKLYNELRQWLATESDPSSQAALQEWRKICAFTTPASEQQRAVVMPERLPVRMPQGRNLPQGYAQAWNDCLAEFLRLNPHLAKGEGV